MINPTLVYGPTADVVSRALITAGAYRLKLESPEEEWFVWKSKIRAPVYTDCRVLPGYPGECAIVSAALGSSIRANFPDAEYVVGMASAGIVWAALAGRELARPFAFVRKEKKEHGASDGLVECSPPRGVRAVVVDDLVASGSSLLHAINALHDELDITTIGIQSIVNWDFKKMRETFANLDIPVRALASFPHLLRAAVDAKLITPQAMSELSKFYADPKNHLWDLSALTIPVDRAKCSAS